MICAGSPIFDVYQLLDDGDEKYIGRYVAMLPMDIMKLFAEDSDINDWILQEDATLWPGWFFMKNRKNNETYRIQLFQ